MRPQQDVAGMTAPSTETVLHQKLSQLEKRAHALIEVNNRISQAVGRLLNPRPAEATKDAPPSPIASTIEGRMNMIISMLDAAQQSADENASDLDSAI